MPVTRNALLRYRSIDQCLRNRRRRWTLEDLIEAVSDALFQHGGIDKGISRRSIQADLQVMRSAQLGYHAPIVVTEKKYYSYADPDYSITQIPLSEQDLARMNEAVEVLKQFRGFSHFSELGEVLQKLEDHVYTAAHRTPSVIDFEKNEGLRGLGHLDALYRAITQRQVLQLTYRSFTAKAPSTFSFHAWWLKEFKNRWFAVGLRNGKGAVTTLALDRIEALALLDTEMYVPSVRYDAATYYQHVVGVTVHEGKRPVPVRLWVDAGNAPYVETKPIHGSQQVESRNEDGSIIVVLQVQLNYELEREILGFGPGMEVLAPEALRRTIAQKVEACGARYAACVKTPESNGIRLPEAIPG
ncbi:WYL domain-containing protein [Flaviaesturariibacter amylovorans]|uniref:WYL domain-containing protein n=1 Tax=Flaviaesturariibacter amylovorans TaxID=1084520 RepID=A0ABP8G6X2_9BACT